MKIPAWPLLWILVVLNHEQTDFLRNALGDRPITDKMFLERIQLRF